MFSIPENTCQGLPPGPQERNREAKSWGGRRADPVLSPPGFHHKGFDFFPPCRLGRGGNRQDKKEENVTPFHAVSTLRNPSLPAGIIVAGATPA